MLWCFLLFLFGFFFKFALLEKEDCIHLVDPLVTTLFKLFYFKSSRYSIFVIYQKNKYYHSTSASGICFCETMNKRTYIVVTVKITRSGRKIILLQHLPFWLSACLTWGSWKLIDKLEQFFFNCSQEDWDQSWNRRKDSILDCSVVTQGCPCQAAKGSNGFSPIKSVQLQASGDCFCAPFPQVQWSFVCAMLKVGNSPLRICSASCFRLTNVICIENSCLCCYTLAAFLCASALQ